MSFLFVFAFGGAISDSSLLSAKTENKSESNVQGPKKKKKTSKKKSNKKGKKKKTQKMETMEVNQKVSTVISSSGAKNQP